MKSVKDLPASVPYVVMAPYNAVVVLLTTPRHEKAFCDVFGSPKGCSDSHGYACMYVHNASGETFFVVCVRNGGLSTLAHECSHSAFHMCGHYGIKVTHKNNEMHAYILGWLFERFEPHVIRARGKK